MRFESPSETEIFSGIRGSFRVGLRGERKSRRSCSGAGGSGSAAGFRPRPVSSHSCRRSSGRSSRRCSGSNRLHESSSPSRAAVRLRLERGRQGSSGFALHSRRESTGGLSSRRDFLRSSGSSQTGSLHRRQICRTRTLLFGRSLKS